MHLRLNDGQRAFVEEVRRFFASEYPQDVIAKLRNGDVLKRTDHVRAQEALQSRGWLGVGWPAEHGGPGWSPVERYLFEQELERAGAAGIIPMAVIYIGPIICAFGTPEQRKRWLPDILHSRAMWAQGYSEPESGSDLASLRMSAVRDGDDYVLDGTKIWTTGAHWADWIFCLVRTSREARKQDGISMICVPMDSPGIKVEPIVSMDGAHELNRVIFDNVRTSATNRIAEEGKGWHYANVLLASERLSYAHIGRKKADLAAIRKQAPITPANFGATMLDDPVFTTRLARLDIEVAALEIMVLRALTGEPSPAAISALKIACTEAAQGITALWLEMAGPYRARFADRTSPAWRDDIFPGQAFGPARTAEYLFERAQTIYGGATEVQRNIIWRQIAQGLPV
jgi:alkylation response protein AidB-like acyl-CoA dehydrogenase